MHKYRNFIFVLVFVNMTIYGTPMEDIPDDAYYNNDTNNQQSNFFYEITNDDGSESSANETDVYVDQLIDEKLAQESLEEYEGLAKKSKLNFFNQLELRGQWFNNNQTDNTNFAIGFDYTAFFNSDNYGNFSLNFNSVNQNYDYTNNISENTNDTYISNYTLTQTAMPLTESSTLNNILGTHQTNSIISNAISQNRRYLVSRRFNDGGTFILGFTSQYINKKSSFAVTHGFLGENTGILFPRFKKSAGKLSRLQYVTTFNKNHITADYWRTSGLDDATAGYKMTLDSEYSNNWMTSFSVASSGDSKAFLAAGEQVKNRLNQYVGVYYYDPDFLWVDKLIGNDNYGAYYRFAKNSTSFNYGASAEYRRDGINDTRLSRETWLNNFNINKRLSKKVRLSAIYSYRQVEDLYTSTFDTSYRENSLRSFLNFTHGNSDNSTLGLYLKYRDAKNTNSDITSKRLDYSYNHIFNQDSSINLDLEYQTNTENDIIHDNYNINVTWDKNIGIGKTFSLNTGYNGNTDKNSEVIGYNMNLNYNWQIKHNMSYNIQIGYNNVINSIDNQLDTSENLVTEILDEENLELNSLSVQMSFNYSFGNSNSSNVLSPISGNIGSGSVTGRIFVDENHDGIYQHNEKILPNINVYMDNIYPMKTNKFGEYTFNYVGTGKHYVYINELHLPLPWSLKGKQTYAFQIKLRDTTTIDIPVYDVSDIVFPD